MNYDEVIRIAAQGLALVLMISLPITAVSALVGLLVSLFQAITSLQDQAMSHGLKLLVVTMVIFFVAPWACAQVVSFAQSAILGATG